jgi:hypothetical protein
VYLAQNWGKARPTSPISKFLSLIHINFIFKKNPLIRCSVRLYLQLFVGRIISYLLYLCLFSHSGVQHMSWIVVLLCFSSSCVLCIQYCQFLLFGHLNVLHLYSLTSIVYLYFVFCLFTISYTYIVSHRMILRRVGCLTSRDQYFSCIMTRTSHILSISFISFILNKPSLFDTTKHRHKTKDCIDYINSPLSTHSLRDWKVLRHTNHAEVDMNTLWRC